METRYGDPLEAWSGWADRLEGVKLESGHHMAEEIPAELVAAIRTFIPG